MLIDDDQAAAKLCHQCRRADPEASDQEILHFLELSIDSRRRRAVVGGNWREEVIAAVPVYFTQRIPGTNCTQQGLRISRGELQGYVAALNRSLESTATAAAFSTPASWFPSRWGVSRGEDLLSATGCRPITPAPDAKHVYMTTRRHTPERASAWYRYPSPRFP